MEARSQFGPFPSRRISVAQQELQNYAGGNRDQDIVSACLNPMVTTGRGAQVVAAPVVDHVLAVAVFGRQVLALIITMVGARTAFVVVLVLRSAPRLS